MSVQCFLFEFRHSSEKRTKDEMIEWCNEYFKFWAFQGEQGDDDKDGNKGYLHWQGAGSLIKKRRAHEIKNVMRKDDGFLPEHFEPMATASAENIKSLEGLKKFYATKKDTRVEGPYFSADNVVEYVPIQYRGMNLWPWQATLVTTAKAECAAMEDRGVNVIYDPIGCHGKSKLACYIALNKLGFELPPLNDYKEITQAACDIFEAKQCRSPGILMMDIPRAMDKKSWTGFVTACEQMKKGHVVDVRHHYREWWFDTPSVWCFSNELPPMHTLSKDRFKIWTFKADPEHPDDASKCQLERYNYVPPAPVEPTEF